MTKVTVFFFVLFSFFTRIPVVVMTFDWCIAFVTCTGWPGLGLPSPKAIVVIPKINSCQNYLRKKRVKVQSTACHYATKKRPVKIKMHLGLDSTIKLKFTTNFDRCAILNVLNRLT